MGNETEREAFEAEWMARRADDEGNPAPRPLRSLYDPEQYRGSGANGSWVWFQRGAAYQREQNAYRLAVDTGLVCAHIGVTNPEDDYETAIKKLNDLICWSIQVDRDLGREQDKGLVEALEDAVDDYDAWKKDAEVTPNESLLNWVTKAKEALAIYRAAQEGE